MTENSALNVNAFAQDWRANALANFPLAPFVLDGVVCASVEGFVQGIKFPPEHPVRDRAFLSHSYEAKRYGEQAGRLYVWWNGAVLKYGSDDHHRLIGRSIRAKFFYNEGLRVAMRATKGLRLIHDLGPESATTSLPAKVFCRILTDLRDELLNTGTVASP